MSTLQQNVLRDEQCKLSLPLYFFSFENVGRVERTCHTSSEPFQLCSSIQDWWCQFGNIPLSWSKSSEIRQSVMLQWFQTMKVIWEGVLGRIISKMFKQTGAWDQSMRMYLLPFFPLQWVIEPFRESEGSMWLSARPTPFLRWPGIMAATIQLLASVTPSTWPPLAPGPAPEAWMSGRCFPVPIPAMGTHKQQGTCMGVLATLFSYPDHWVGIPVLLLNIFRLSP